MGWWRIDPLTGAPLRDSPSRLSRPGDVVLLNAVPGVDDDDGACYLGDGPGDMAFAGARELAGLLGDSRRLDADGVRQLLGTGLLPRAEPAQRTAIERCVKAFWADIDDCYDFDWGRPARPEERRWIVEYVVAAMARQTQTA